MPSVCPARTSKLMSCSVGSGLAARPDRRSRRARSAARRRSIDEVAGARPVGDLGLAIEHLEQPGAGHRGAREGVDHHAELAHRHLQDRHEGEIFGQHADRDLARQHLAGRRPRAGGPSRGRRRRSSRRCCGRAGRCGDRRAPAPRRRRRRTCRARRAARRTRAPRGCRRGSPPSPGSARRASPAARASSRAGAAAPPPSARRRTARSSARSGRAPARGRSSRIGAGADQDREQHEPDQPGVDHASGCPRCRACRG